MNRKRLFFFLVIAFIVSGCYSVRKKFVRKKKRTEPQNVYIELKEYPAVPVKELYEDWYLFTNAWLDEMVEGLRSEFNYKRQKYALSEAIKNMDKIRQAFNAEGKEKISPLYNELLSLEGKLSPTPSTIERNYLLQRIESVRIRFGKGFVYSKVSQWIEKD